MESWQSWKCHGELESWRRGYRAPEPTCASRRREQKSRPRPPTEWLLAINNAEQREASMTSADWLRIIKAVIQNIDKAIAQYSSWRPAANQLETAKSSFAILLLTATAQIIRSKLTSDGPQSVVQSEPKICLEVLLGWLHLKARLEGVNIEEMKQLLFEVA